MASLVTRFLKLMSGGAASSQRPPAPQIGEADLAALAKNGEIRTLLRALGIRRESDGTWTRPCRVCSRMPTFEDCGGHNGRIVIDLGEAQRNMFYAEPLVDEPPA